ncbi:collagen alpha-1(XII) chain-like isoform X3 [Branchiostoma floridae]|uniref:Collagen alpha-1(XII) chain-like isoform X3 n=1 Tax=Branchiostoma floridae TaxID=7739 RepID=A0A9J7LMX2_BRAFL|nr:collagen alpha-1(XII) chain-like isoform X3 [Branchiostoma floridae]
MIVLTDGQSGDSVVASAQALAADQVTVFAIGVGSFDHSELLQITNNNQGRVFELADFSAIAQNINRIAGAVCIEPTQAVTTVAPTALPTLEPCDLSLDLFFVLDGSGSVGFADFDMVKQFVVAVVSTFTISLTDTRVGVLQYSDGSTLECNLGDHPDESSFVSAVSGMARQGGGTRTGRALEFARLMAAWRPAPVPRIMIVLTDGQSFDSVVASAQALAADQVTVFAIGVGSFDHSELLQITNNNQGRVFELADFSAIAQNINRIAGAVCIEPTQAVTTVAPTALPTLEPCDLSLDLFFVLDGSGSVSVADFDMVKQFVVAVVSTFTISLTDTRVGVLQYSDGSTLECNLGDHPDESSFASAVSTMTYQNGGTSTGAALEFARQMAAWRPAPVPRIMIVLTDGKSGDSVVAPAQALAADQVAVFAIGVGSFYRPELLQITNNNQGRVFELADFSAIAQNINRIARAVCIEPTQAVTTVAPTALPTVEPCDESVDLFFVLDGSGSVSIADFDIVKEFVVAVVSGFTISLTETRVGVLQYSHFNTLGCNLGDHPDWSSFVNSMNTMTRQDGGTNTGAALEFARQRAAWRAAPVPRIMIVLTDGKSSDGVVAPSMALDADQVTVFAIGVGSFDSSELLQITNYNQDRVFELTDFNAIAQITNRIIQAACMNIDSATTQETTTMQTTTAAILFPTVEPCDVSSDLFFVLDGSGSVGHSNFNTVKQFVVTLVSAFTIGLNDVTDTRVGVIQYSSGNALECNLGDHPDESSFVTAINTMTYQDGYSTKTGAALQFASQSAAWRPAPIPRIMIVLTDGMAHDSVVAPSQALAADQVNVFAIGVGNFDRPELLQITNNNPGRVFELADFDAIRDKINDIALAVCMG